MQLQQLSDAAVQRLLRNFIEITLRHWCSVVNLLRIFRTPFLRTPLDGYFLTLSFQILLLFKFYFRGYKFFFTQIPRENCFLKLLFFFLMINSPRFIISTFQNEMQKLRKLKFSLKGAVLVLFTLYKMIFAGVFAQKIKFSIKDLSNQNRIYLK